MGVGGDRFIMIMHDNIENKDCYAADYCACAYEKKGKKTQYKSAKCPNPLHWIYVYKLGWTNASKKQPPLLVPDEYDHMHSAVIL